MQNRASWLVVLVVVLTAAPATASDPGQPFDCSDWVILDAGITCSVEVPFPCDTAIGTTPFPACANGSPSVGDNDGRLIFVETEELGEEMCGGASPASVSRQKIVALDHGTMRVLAYIDDRCSDVPGGFDRLQAGRLAFDPSSGRLTSGIHLWGNGFDGYQRVEFLGFTTTFEILQSYSAPTSTLGFRVPYMPEGFAAADWFDTYWGNLSEVGDWSKVHPLQCAYPATAPQVGDYLKVADTLPTPGPGHGYYYVTSVVHSGQTRYGRKTTAGVLSGRDPAVLPVCEQ